MCFSPIASFTAAAITAATGCVAVGRCSGWREVPLAAIPLVFASQQAAEGEIWLQLRHQSHTGTLQLSTHIFVFLALVVWPVLAPGAALLVEPAPERRRLQRVLLAPGLAASAYSAWDMSVHPYVPSIMGGSVCYVNNNAFPHFAAGAYFLAAAIPFLVSSHGAVRLFGLTVIAGLAVSLAAYYFTFVSVWCFFAAAASISLYGYFRRQPVRALAP